ncbi:MAG: hypothetical protein HeimC2_18450 [Candidatus Heimdallarchaeota archaeon LC_2]|nr:MAG: hypothetical protein HeimC2_18450 [Candidatus Heimdallarchaeota archaeon LC_2]
MYQPPYSTSKRISQSLKLATIHTLAIIGYLLVLLILYSFILNNISFVGLILLLIILPIIIVTGMLAAYIYTTSFSRNFACRIAYFQAIKISFGLCFQLFIYGILAMVITGFIFYISFSLGLLFFFIEYTLFPLTVFYFVQEWVLENQSNLHLSNKPNPNFVNFGGPMIAPIQYGYQQSTHPQVAQPPSQPQYNQQQQGPSFQGMDQQPAKVVQSQTEEPQTKQNANTIHNFCDFCGGKLDDFDGQYCGKCGRPTNQ